MTTKISNLKKAVTAAVFGAIAVAGAASAVEAGQPQGAFKVALIKPMGCYTIAKGSHHQPANPNRGVYVVNSTGFWLPAGKLVKFKVSGGQKWRSRHLAQPLAPGSRAKVSGFGSTVSLNCKAFTF